MTRLGFSPSSLDALADYIDEDSQVRPNGAEDAAYLANSSPSLAANAPLLRVAELAVVRGFGARRGCAHSRRSFPPFHRPPHSMSTPRRPKSWRRPSAGSTTMHWARCSPVAQGSRSHSRRISRASSAGCHDRQRIGLTVSSKFFLVTVRRARVMSSRASVRCWRGTRGNGRHRMADRSNRPAKNIKDAQVTNDSSSKLGRQRPATPRKPNAQPYRSTLTTLRVLLPAAPTAARADAWALYDDQGKLVREGRDAPAT